MMADYNGWADEREEERESTDATFWLEYEGSGFVEQARIRVLESGPRESSIPIRPGVKRLIA
jgi:hypothetical protein